MTNRLITHLAALVTLLLTLPAPSPASPATAQGATEVAHCATASGPTADGFGNVLLCSGTSASAGTDGATPTPSAGDGCIELFTATERLYGCGPTELTSLFVEPILGTATIRFSVVSEQRPDVTLHATVTLIGITPPFPFAGAQHGADLGHAWAAGSASASAYALRLAITGPGSAISASSGEGGEMPVGSEGAFGSGVSAGASAGADASLAQQQ